MKINAKGLKLIKDSEGCVMHVYPDPGTKGRPFTAGCGHAGADIQGMKIGDKVTETQVDNWLKTDVAGTELAVSNYCKGVSLNTNQFSALVCFAFNVKGWRSTPLFTLIKAGKFTEASLLFSHYNHGGGKVLPGLTRRRAAEEALFNTPEESA